MFCAASARAACDEIRAPGVCTLDLGDYFNSIGRIRVGIAIAFAHIRDTDIRPTKRERFRAEPYVIKIRDASGKKVAEAELSLGIPVGNDPQNVKAEQFLYVVGLKNDGGSVVRYARHPASAWRKHKDAVHLDSNAYPGLFGLDGWWEVPENPGLFVPLSLVDGESEEAHDQRLAESPDALHVSYFAYPVAVDASTYASRLANATPKQGEASLARLLGETAIVIAEAVRLYPIQYRFAHAFAAAGGGARVQDRSRRPSQLTPPPR